jgi:hypothetical protein
MKDISHLSKHLSYCLLAKAATMNPQKKGGPPHRLRRKPLTETQRHGENFSTGTPLSSSASATLSDAPSATTPNPMRKKAAPFLALYEFKRALNAMKYQFMPAPSGPSD